MTQESVSNKLTELFELYKEGALTKDEYDLLKSQIINGGEGQQSKDAEPAIKHSSNLAANNENNSSDNKLDGNDLKKKPNSKISRIVTIVAASSLIIVAAIIISNRNIEWNEVRATKKIMAELNNYPDWASKSYRDSVNWYHHIVGFKKLSLSQKNLMIAITITNEEETAGGGGWYSIFEFDEKVDGS